MSSTNRLLGRATAVSLTSAALAFSGIAAAHADGGGQGKPPAHSQAGGKSKAPGKPGQQGSRGHQGDPGHQGVRGHGGDPGHQGSKGGNQGTPGAAEQPTPQGGPETGGEPTNPQTPGDDVSGAGHNPPGNNGTIKIEQLRADGTPQNNPHQSCQLRVEWYGFDEGTDVVSRLSFDAQAPTSGSTISVAGDTSVPVGGDPASGAGTDTGLDGSEVYTLSFSGAPHPQQGYHVKVTVHTPYSLGNDSKSKVFWMQPCTGGGSDGGSDGGSATGASPRPSDVLTTSDVSWSSAATTGPGQDPGTDEGDGAVPVPTVVDAGSSDSEGARDALPLGLLALGTATTAAAVQLRRRASLR